MTDQEHGLAAPPSAQDEKLRTPWTPEQVAALNAFQQRGDFHPFTCGNDSTHPNLVAHEDGWHCSACEYRQEWAHAFMASGDPHGE